ncbi:MAG: ribosome maturation factor RimM [Bacteroidota bacterium]
MSDDFVELGYILRAHGIRGEVKVVLDVQDPTDYLSLSGCYLALNASPPTRYKINRFTLAGKNQAIIKFKTINDRDAAETLKGHTLLIPQDALPDLGNEHFYYFEIEGFTVLTPEREEIGKVIRIDEMPAQDLLVIDYKSKEIPLPLVEEIFLGVNKEKKQVQVHIPDGFLELYAEEEE